MILEKWIALNFLLFFQKQILTKQCEAFILHGIYLCIYFGDMICKYYLCQTKRDGFKMSNDSRYLPLMDNLQ